MADRQRLADALLAPPDPSFGVARHPAARGAADLIVKALQGAGNVMAAPGQLAQSAPQTPGMWSEEDQFRADAAQAGMVPWAGDMAMNMVGAPVAPRGALGSGTGKGIRAYHGSPHDFDRFDLSKIGTGEGAQAYGHGLYFAEKEATAKSYRDALASSVLPKSLAEGPNEIARYWIGEAKGDTGTALKLFDKFMNESVPKHMRDPRSAAQIEETRSLIQKPPGHMYEVNIRAEPQQFLDWDKPLQAQPQHQSMMQALIAAHPSLRDVTANPYSTGQVLESALTHRITGSHPEASKALREAGLPGIKYLDQGSRGAGEGTSNYVLFNDKIIDILRKYGLAGLTAGGVGAATMQDTGQQ
jgi:hypothetical protein